MEVRDGQPVGEIAAHYGVSRQTVTTWRKRYDIDGLDGLREVSRRPHHKSVTNRPEHGGRDLRDAARAPALGRPPDRVRLSYPGRLRGPLWGLKICVVPARKGGYDTHH
jgi:hypothetical protein